MGFYYGSGQPPEDDDRPGGFKEVVIITLTVFRVLALPLAIIVGGLLALVLLLYLFTFNAYAGLAIIVLGLAALVARGIWEAKHPPKLE